MLYTTFLSAVFFWIALTLSTALEFNRWPDDSTSEGEPLFLTRYIDSNRMSEGREKAKVEPFAKAIESYAGYLTVDKRLKSNLFFWFFPSATNWTNAPVTIWLQGGPGYSGLFGLFNELGPYMITEEGTLKTRKYSWHRKCNLIFIDSPVGTGYSFTQSLDGYAKNEMDVARDLHTALVQFFKLFPEIKTNPFHIAGESYAGKYIPALGHTIHTNNPSSDVKINLQGLFIGNGLTDPENMIPKYGDQLYALGFIDYNERLEFLKHQKRTVKAIRNEDWDEATLLYNQLIIGYSFFPFPTLYTNTTGLTTYYNFVNEYSAAWQPFEERFVQSKRFKNAVHVGDTKRDIGLKTEKLLMKDIARSTVRWVEELVEHYRVMFYNGQLDIICAYPLTENFLRKMKWSGASRYRTAKRKLWMVNGRLAGYVKRAGNLYDVLVRNSGHMVPTDQPEWAFELFNKFVYNIPL